jgi:predicted negative regulator of RcsB-dependent stress response
VDLHASDQEQIDALRDWWKENGMSVIAGVVLGLGAIFGWRGWQSHVAAQTEAASAQYDALAALVQENAAAEKIAVAAERVVSEHPKSGYAVFARLALARAAVDAADLERAAVYLREALEHATEAPLKNEIRLRLARVLLAQGKNDEAFAQLDTAQAGAYLSAFAELRGDIEVRRGNADAARSEYQAALKSRAADAADLALLELKLDSLGHGTGS